MRLSVFKSRPVRRTSAQGKVRKPKSKQREGLYRKLAVLLRHGVPLDVGLTKEQRKGSRSRAGRGLAAVLARVIEATRQGKDIGSAFGPWVPRIEEILLRSGDKSGNLAEAFDHARTVAEATRKIRSAILSALVPSLLNFLVLIVVLVVLGGYIVPQFTAILPPKAWTGTAHQLYTLSILVRSVGFYVGLGIFLATLATVLITMPWWTGRVRNRLDQFPPWSLFRLKEGAGWMIALGVLVKSGVPITDALRTIAGSSQPWLRERTQRALVGLSAGNNLGIALRRGGGSFPDPEIVDDLVTYADLGDFGERIYDIGMQWLDEALAMIQRKAAAIKMLLMICFGLVLVWFTIGTIALQNSIAGAGTMLGQLH